MAAERTNPRRSRSSNAWKSKTPMTQQDRVRAERLVFPRQMMLIDRCRLLAEGVQTLGLSEEFKQWKGSISSSIHISKRRTWFPIVPRFFTSTYTHHNMYICHNMTYAGTSETSASIMSQLVNQNTYTVSSRGWLRMAAQWQGEQPLISIMMSTARFSLEPSSHCTIAVQKHLATVCFSPCLR